MSLLAVLRVPTVWDQHESNIGIVQGAAQGGPRVTAITAGVAETCMEVSAMQTASAPLPGFLRRWKRLKMGRFRYISLSDKPAIMEVSAVLARVYVFWERKRGLSIEQGAV